LLSQVVANGSAYHVNGTKYLRQVVGGRRGIEAYLWTDYSDHLIVYLCQENFVDEVLRSNGMQFEYLKQNNFNNLRVFC